MIFPEITLRTVSLYFFWNRAVTIQLITTSHLMIGVAICPGARKHGMLIILCVCVCVHACACVGRCREESILQFSDMLGFRPMSDIPTQQFQQSS